LIKTIFTQVCPNSVLGLGLGLGSPNMQKIKKILKTDLVWVHSSTTFLENDFSYAFWVIYYPVQLMREQIFSSKFDKEEVIVSKYFLKHTYCKIKF